jgi:ketosteroid isomerase-like protein
LARLEGRLADVDRALAMRRLERFHAAQGGFYAGGPEQPLRELLTTDVVWHVPGRNAIAGVYEGVDAVMAYFARRRDLASRTFRLHPGDVLVGEYEHVAVLTDGTAVLDGVEHRWSTVGLYRFEGERVASCWLLPLDPEEFDAIWSTQG